MIFGLPLLYATVHLIKKVTFYAYRTGTGMGVVRTMDERATSMDMGVVSAILSDKNRSKMLAFLWHQLVLE